MNRSPICADGLVAGAAAALLSGAPSTLHAVATGRDPIAATVAAGGLMLPRERSRVRLVVAGGVVHVTISLAWGLVLAALLPRRRTVAAGALAGFAIATLDLSVAGRRGARIRELPRVPQLADHVAYGAVAAVVISRRRRLSRG